MIVCIGGVLDATALARVAEILARGSYVEGKRTAGWHARAVKENRQLAPGAEAEAAGAIIDVSSIFGRCGGNCEPVIT